VQGARCVGRLTLEPAGLFTTFTLRTTMREVRWSTGRHNQTSIFFQAALTCTGFFPRMYSEIVLMQSSYKRQCWWNIGIRSEAEILVVAFLSDHLASLFGFGNSHISHLLVSYLTWCHDKKNYAESRHKKEANNNNNRRDPVPREGLDCYERDPAHHPVTHPGIFYPRSSPSSSLKKKSSQSLTLCSAFFTL